MNIEEIKKKKLNSYLEATQIKGTIEEESTIEDYLAGWNACQSLLEEQRPLVIGSQVLRLFSHWKEEGDYTMQNEESHSEEVSEFLKGYINLNQKEDE